MRLGPGHHAPHPALSGGSQRSSGPRCAAGRRRAPGGPPPGAAAAPQCSPAGRLTSSSVAGSAGARSLPSCDWRPAADTGLGPAASRALRRPRVRMHDDGHPVRAQSGGSRVSAHSTVYDRGTGSTAGLLIGRASMQICRAPATSSLHSASDRKAQKLNSHAAPADTA